jgi:hypothetical protein
MSDFELDSTRDGVRLALSASGPRAYTVALAGRDLSVATTIHDVLGEGYEFPTFWQDIASSWKGWSGEKSWSSIEGDFQLTATSDSLGHVTIRCHLSSGAPEGWSATVWLHAEAGNLEAIAANAVRFAESLDMAV